MRKAVRVASAARTTPYWPLFVRVADAPADAREGSRSARLIQWDWREVIVKRWERDGDRDTYGRSSSRKAV